MTTVIGRYKNEVKPHAINTWVGSNIDEDGYTYFINENNKTFASDILDQQARANWACSEDDDNIFHTALIFKEITFPYAVVINYNAGENFISYPVNSYEELLRIS